MANTTSTPNAPKGLLAISEQRPVQVMLVLLLAAALFKILDTFILRLDEELGEAILTKSAGFVLVVAYVWLCGRKLRDIGFRTRAIGRALLVGAVCFSALFALSYAVQLTALLASGEEARLALSAGNPRSGMEGGLLFGLWLMLGNLVNSAMEEGLFLAVWLPGHLVSMLVIRWWTQRLNMPELKPWNSVG